MSTAAKPGSPAVHALRTCPSCRTGHLHESSRNRVFHPHGQELIVPLLTSTCDHCGADATSASQHDENLRRLAARKSHYGELLMGEEIHALRRRYGLTQQRASQIFGKGKIAFSRYESETSYPDDSTRLLLQLAIDKPDVIKTLADKAGVELPLWSERCEDEQRVKVRPLAKVYDAAQAGPKHQERYVASGSASVLGGSFAKLWSAQRMATQHQTLTLPDASNDGCRNAEAIAS